jgi:hypothetical protein
MSYWCDVFLGLDSTYERQYAILILLSLVSFT